MSIKTIHTDFVKGLLEGSVADKKKLQQEKEQGIKLEKITRNIYLPHQPVIKERSSTTPIRPVFDASVKLKGHPSLNQCLQFESNRIKLIPDILARFKAKKFGITSDIGKAFLKKRITHKTEDVWETPVQGLKWNRELDSLCVTMNWMKSFGLEKLMKRVKQSEVYNGFDPIGFIAPVMLCLDLILQKTCKMSIGCDAEVTEILREKFLQLFQNLKILEGTQVDKCNSRKFEALHNSNFLWCIKEAYAAVVFLRLEEEDSVKPSVLAAKSIIAQLRGGTIPRRELLATLIRESLTNSAVEALNQKEVKSYYWIDSTTVPGWIRREENWSVFVRCRIQEIRKLTSFSSGSHTAGELNPAFCHPEAVRENNLCHLDGERSHSS
ncbi:uncharacterized protein TNCV_4737041 [Trichonephila clavipes]|nr:uncharacterized protein TNCV_4737041 [Trichonephila clavipes]